MSIRRVSNKGDGWTSKYLTRIILIDIPFEIVRFFVYLLQENSNARVLKNRVRIKGLGMVFGELLQDFFKHHGMTIFTIKILDRTTLL